MAIVGSSEQQRMFEYLLKATDAEIARLRDSFARGMVGVEYGQQVRGLVTAELLNAVEHQRHAKAMNSRTTYRDNEYHHDYKYREDYNLASNLREQLNTARNQNSDYRDRLDRAEQELSDLRRRFESLFRVPAVGMRTEMDQPPESPEQWRVRIHVPAFTVETTMGALTAAKNAPGMAMTWGQAVALQTSLLQIALDNAKTHIATHIVTGNHPIESAEPEPPQEPT